MKPKLTTESQEQRAVFEWAAYMSKQWPELELLYHCPNGGSRNKAEAAKLKAEGVRAGIPDLILPVARYEFHGLAIEMKSKGGKMTPAQVMWQARLIDEGWNAVTCYSAQEAIETITRYLGEAK